MRTEVKLEADRLAEALRERVENLQGGGAPQAMAKACQIVLRTAKRYAPKSPESTGLLRRSLTYRVVREGEDIVGQVGTNVHYAIHVEYGHRTRASKNAIGQIKYVPGVYFLHRALRENRNKVRGVIIEELGRHDGS